MAESVQVSYLHGQIDALYESVVTIWLANRGFIQGACGGEDVDAAIDAAMRLLPDELLKKHGAYDEHEPKEFGHQQGSASKGQWDDLL